MDSLKCNICFNTYNSSNLRPRVLICGHTFCEKCLNITIKNEILVCPQCRKTHELNSVLELPVNFLAEGLLKYLKISSNDVSGIATPRAIDGSDVSQGAISLPIDGRSDKEEESETNGNMNCILKQHESSLFSQKELLKKSAGRCIEHPSEEYMLRCSSHKSWVCERCIEDLGDHPKHKCKIISFEEEIDKRRQEQKSFLEDEGKSCNETMSQVERQIIILKEEKDQHLSLINGLQILVEIHKKEEETLQNEIISYQDIIENGKQIKEKLLSVEETVSNAGTLDESNAARDIIKNKIIETRNWLSITQKELDEGKLMIEKSSNLGMATKKSLQHRESCVLSQQEFDNEDICQKKQNTSSSSNMVVIEDTEVIEDDYDSEIETYETFKKNVDLDIRCAYEDESEFLPPIDIDADSNSNSDSDSDSGESNSERDISDSEKCISENEMMEIIESGKDMCTLNASAEIKLILDNREQYKFLCRETCLMGHEVINILKNSKENTSERSEMIKRILDEREKDKSFV